MVTEHDFELDVLDWLDNTGWTTYVETRQSPTTPTPLDNYFDRERTDTILWNKFEDALIRLNPEVTPDNVERVTKKLKNSISGGQLMDANKAVHMMLRGGTTVALDTGDGRDNVHVHLIDYDDPDNNSFIAGNQFSVKVQTNTIRTDVVLFINGLPVVVSELKSQVQGETPQSAINDLHTYENTHPGLFATNVLNIAATEQELRYGAVGAPEQHYNPWNSNTVSDVLEGTVEGQFKSLTHPETLLSIIQGFVFYAADGEQINKVIPRHQQFDAVNAIVDRVGHARAHDRNGTGLLWHTQGSGKSYAMLYAGRHFVREHSAQVVVLVDTDDLNGQMQRILNSLSPGFNHRVAKTKKHLETELSQGSAGILVTTIQKFEEIDRDVQGNEFTVVFADEAHRFMEKKLGNRLEKALPNAHHFGFTGTPVDEGDPTDGARNTWNNYQYPPAEEELYLHRYSMKDGCEEGVITQVTIQTRAHNFIWDFDPEELDDAHRQKFKGLTDEERQQKIEEEMGSRELSELPVRVDAVAEDIHEHYTTHVEPSGFKGMVVAPSRKSAAMYAERLREHLGNNNVDALITEEKGDSALLRKYHKSDSEQETAIENFADAGRTPKIMVVCNMLLTGFDAPVLQTIYLDRTLKDYRLLQAMARTNRPTEDKVMGEIIDYEGIEPTLQTLFTAADAHINTYIGTDKQTQIDEFSNLLNNELPGLFPGVNWGDRSSTIPWIDCLDSESKQKQFNQTWRELQKYYEAIAPDKRLVEHEADMAWFGKLYKSLNTSTGKDPRFKRETLKVLNEHVDIAKVGEDYSEYTISGTEVESKPAEIVRKKHGLLDILEGGKGISPKFSELSDKVERVVREWNQDVITDPEAVLERLREIEREVVELDDLGELSEEELAELAITQLLEAEFDDELDFAQPDKVAVVVVNTYLDGGYDQRPSLTSGQKRQFHTNLRRALIQKYNGPAASLATSDEFFEKATIYLEENLAVPAV